MSQEIATPLFFILTGGPGSGKSSIINEMDKSGHSIMAETGRKIIQEQIAAQGIALPWKDKQKFRDLMIERDINQYLKAKELKGPVLFDRGIPDSLGYSKLEKIPVNDSLRQKIKNHPYQPLAFIMPPWKEIYVNDAERKQNFATAVATYNATKSIYLELGYEILELPKISVKERIKIICDTIKNNLIPNFCYS